MIKKRQNGHDGSGIPLFLLPIGSMVLYMVTWIPSIYPSHVWVYCWHVWDIHILYIGTQIPYMLATGNMFPSIYPIHGSYWHFDAKNDVCIYPIRSMVLVENANMTGFFVDGIHDTAYIPAPLGSVMGYKYFHSTQFCQFESKSKSKPTHHGPSSQR